MGGTEMRRPKGMLVDDASAPAANAATIDEELSRIAERLRRWREEAGLTLQELAGRAGIATSTVQKIETAQMVPSIAVVLKVARGLGRNPGEVLGGAAQAAEVDVVHLTPGSRQRIGDPDRLVVERLTGDVADAALDVWRVVLQPGAGCGSEPIRYAGEEFIQCEKGRLTVTILARDHTLSAGDTLHFKANLPHSWRNDGRAVTVFTITGTLPRKLREALNAQI
jgi:transcriptional regulator with XRE-family HTH domain